MATSTQRTEQWWDAYALSYLTEHDSQLPIDEPTWSVWMLPETEVGALGDYRDRDVIELGSGAAQLSISLARNGARCTALDISAEQQLLAERLLDHAEELDGHRPDVTLVRGDAEDTGLPAESFDHACSDYGASMFADPLRWVPEAARLLRPGGRLAFSAITPILEVCWPKELGAVSDRLVKDYFGLHRVEERVSYFNLPYGEWIRLFRRSGFDVLDMIETRPPPGVLRTAYRSENQVAWARRWPAEMIWVVEKRA
jgi:SAM-dependent methyltransferase